MEGTADDAISMDDLAARGAGGSDADWEARWSSVTPDDICTFIYTSGTTGPPKGCVISHGNYRSMLDMVHEANVLGDEELTYLFLPLAHSFALLIQLGTLRPRRHPRLLGARPAEDHPQPDRGEADLLPVGPPHLREDLHRRDRQHREGGRPQEGRSSTGPIGVGKKVRERERAGKPIGWLLEAPVQVRRQAGALARSAALFGGNLKLAVTGAAPINPEILRFFDAAGVLVVEGWGMTETSTAATISRPEAFKFGTVGKPFNGLRDQDRRRRRDPGQGPEHLPGLLQERRGDQGDDRRRLAAHRRHRRVRLRRLPEDHRPQEGHHHHRGRQEHHPRQPRGRDQAEPLRLAVRRDRRPPALPDRPGDARHRGGREARRGEGLARRPRRSSPSSPRCASDHPGPHRRDQREVRAGRAGEEVRDPARRPLAGGRRADADAEGEAQRRRRQVRAGDRGALLG